MIIQSKFLMFSLRIYSYCALYFPEVPQVSLWTYPKNSHSYTWPNTQLMTDIIISFTLQRGIFICTATAAFHKISHYACSKVLAVLYDVFQIFPLTSQSQRRPVTPKKICRTIIAFGILISCVLELGCKVHC